MRCIDADALKEKAFGKRGGLVHASDIDAMPTIEPERKRGTWTYERMKHLLDGTVRKVRICSVCTGGYFVYDESENVIDIEPNFCPNCGADMREESI